MYKFAFPPTIYAAAGNYSIMYFDYKFSCFWIPEKRGKADSGCFFQRFEKGIYFMEWRLERLVKVTSQLTAICSLKVQNKGNKVQYLQNSIWKSLKILLKSWLESENFLKRSCCFWINFHSFTFKATEKDIFQFCICKRYTNKTAVYARL